MIREGERRGGYSSLVPILYPRGEGLVTYSLGFTNVSALSTLAQRHLFGI